MQESQILQRLVAVEERSKSNTKRINEAEARLNENERVLNNVDKSLSVTVEQIKNIAEDLKQTSINFKEAMMRSNTANRHIYIICRLVFNTCIKYSAIPINRPANGPLEPVK